MKKFFKQILNKINKLDKYTSSYIKNSQNIEIPVLAYTNWGMYLADIQDYKSAIDKLETAVLMSNQNPKPYIKLGIIYARLKEYQKSENILKQAIAKDSQNRYPYCVLSSVLIAESKFSEAEEYLKKGLKLSSYDAELYLNYGIWHAKQQNKIKAIEMFKKSKFIKPNNLHTLFLLGVMYFETEKISEAFYEFKQLEKADKKYPKLNYYMALCYKKEKNYSAVLEYGQRALEEEPENYLIYILLAQNYINLNNEAECFKIFNLAEERGIKDFEFYLAWGISLIKAEQIKEAKEKLQSALNINSKNTDALFRMGVCLYKENNLDNAEKYFKEAINSNQNNAFAISDLGLVYYDKKNYNEAINCFLKAIHISAENNYLYFYIANCYYRLGKYKKSLDYYEKTIEYYPRHIEAYINCTVNLMDLQNTREALRKIRSAYQIDRENRKVILTYALTELKSGLFNDAIEKTDLILKKYPDNTEAKLIKSHCLINLNKVQEAINILCSLPEDQQNSILFVYLNYLAYKTLVEESQNHYNESMLNLYAEKLYEMKSDNLSKTEVNADIIHKLNVNKG